MIKTLALNNFLVGIFPLQKNIKFQTSKQSKNTLSFYLGIALLTANIILLGSYIYGVNNYASSGYETRTLQSKIADLNVSIKDLNLQVAKATSMANIQSDFAAANFMPAGTPKFLKEQSNLTFNQ